VVNQPYHADYWKLSPFDAIFLAPEIMESSRNKKEIPGKNDQLVATLIIAGSIVLGLLLRWFMRDFESGDYKQFLSNWYAFIHDNGGFWAYKHIFSNYSPAYLYLLGIANLIPIPDLYSIKLMSMIFDFPLAILAYLIARRHFRTGLKPAWVFALVFLGPTVMVNSSFWGQCDVIYTMFLLGTIYTMMLGRPWLLTMFFGLGFSFKQQTIFMAPVLIASWLKREMPIWNVVLIPLIYIISIIPATIAGRNFIELLFFYKSQAGSYTALSNNAPNMQQFLGNMVYGKAEIGMVILSAIVSAFLAVYFFRAVKNQLKTMDPWGRRALIVIMIAPFLLFLRPFVDIIFIVLKQPNTYAIFVRNIPGARDFLVNRAGDIFGMISLAIAFLGVVSFCFLGWKSRNKILGNTEMVLKLAMFSTLMMPFLLVRMHERYWYPADVISTIFIFFYPKRWYLPFIIIPGSLLAYLSYFADREIVPLPLVAIGMGIALIIAALDYVRTMYPPDKIPTTDSEN